MAAEYLQIMVDKYISLCWERFHTVDEVQEAIDKFMEGLDYAG